MLQGAVRNGGLLGQAVIREPTLPPELVQVTPEIAGVPLTNSLLIHPRASQVGRLDRTGFRADSADLFYHIRSNPNLSAPPIG
jgi:hypothetical protein